MLGLGSGWQLVVLVLLTATAPGSAAQEQQPAKPRRRSSRFNCPRWRRAVSGWETGFRDHPCLHWRDGLSTRLESVGTYTTHTKATGPPEGPLLDLLRDPPADHPAEVPAGAAKAAVPHFVRELPHGQGAAGLLDDGHEQARQRLRRGGLRLRRGWLVCRGLPLRRGRRRGAGRPVDDGVHRGLGTLQLALQLFLAACQLRSRNPASNGHTTQPPDGWRVIQLRPPKPFSPPPRLLGRGHTCRRAGSVDGRSILRRLRRQEKQGRGDRFRPPQPYRSMRGVHGT
jgi:hypothetical protein